MSALYEDVMAAAKAGEFCDCGHYYCPRVQPDGKIVFPSGVVRPDGSISGASRMREFVAKVARQFQDSGPTWAGSVGPQPPECPAVGTPTVRP